jgi:hypothetical protein
MGKNMAQTLTLFNSTIRAEVSLFGGMTSASFSIGTKTVSPFYTHPWHAQETPDVFLQYLHGDFFCLPFGVAPASHALDSVWGCTPEPVSHKGYPHGYSANGIWSPIEKDGDSATIRLDYGQNDIQSVNRRIKLCDHSLLFEDSVETKQATRLPVGIHPIFRLPQTPGAAHIAAPECDGIYTYPIDVDASSRFRNNVVCKNLEQIPCKDGSIVNASQLPLRYAGEELLLLVNVHEGKIVLQNTEEKYQVILEWDNTAYRHCLLWISNRGRQFSPWSNRNLCLGIEPVTAAFDLGEAVSAASNPLQSNGINTAFAFKSNTTTCFRHKVTVEPFDE